MSTCYIWFYHHLSECITTARIRNRGEERLCLPQRGCSVVKVHQNLTSTHHTNHTDIHRLYMTNTVSQGRKTQLKKKIVKIQHKIGEGEVHPGHPQYKMYH